MDQRFLITALLIIICTACGTGAREIEYSPGVLAPEAVSLGALKPGAGAAYSPAPMGELERIAERERAGNFFPGLGFLESSLREAAGDFAGSALAAYKELSWAYAYASISREQVEEGLRSALVFLGENSHVPDSARAEGISALLGCLAFAGEDWEGAELYLSGLVARDEAPDSFLSWMLMVTSLEQAREANGGERWNGRSAYAAIRARYAIFPEYWYRGARAFFLQEGAEDISSSYAEECINLSPQGPFADESRKILLTHAGLGPSLDAHRHIRTRAEIENIIRVSVSSGNPLALEELFPLIALPDNPYTIYALGALRALSQIPEFRAFFGEEAQRSAGRLGERLHFASRG